MLEYHCVGESRNCLLIYLILSQSNFRNSLFHMFLCRSFFDAVGIGDTEQLVRKMTCMEKWNSWLRLSHFD